MIKRKRCLALALTVAFIFCTLTEAVPPIVAHAETVDASINESEDVTADLEEEEASNQEIAASENLPEVDEGSYEELDENTEEETDKIAEETGENVEENLDEKTEDILEDTADEVTTEENEEGLEEEVKLEEELDEVLEEETEEEIELVYTELALNVNGYSILVSGNMPEGTILDAKVIDSAEAEELVSETIGENNTFKAEVTFDINLVYQGEEYQPTEFDEEVTVSITGIDSDKDLQVYRITDDDVVTNMDATSEGDTLEFETDHFTTYTIGEVGYESISEGTWVGFDYALIDTDGNRTEDTVVLSGTQNDKANVYSYYGTNNANNKDTRAPFSDNENITKIKVMPGSKFIDCSNFFCIWNEGYHTNITSIDITGIDTSEVEDMSSMFYGMHYTEIIGIEDLDTSNVTNMSNMLAQMGDDFSDAYDIQSLDLSKWNTSHVTNMVHMFYQTHIKSLNLSNWDVTKVTDLTYMFSATDCEYLDISGWDLSNLPESYENGDGSTIKVSGLLDSIFALRTIKMCRTDKLNYSFDFHFSGLSETGIYSKEGYIIDDNNDDLSDDGVLYTQTKPNESVPHIYKKAYCVEFNTDGGSEVANQLIVIDRNKTVTKPDDPTKDGYDFIGWYFYETYNPSSDGNGRSTYEVNKDSAEDYDFTRVGTAGNPFYSPIYAKWKEKTYKVTFETNGGTLYNNLQNDTNTMEVVASFFKTNYPPYATKDGYYFGGWYYDEELTKRFEDTDLITSDTTLYAKWESQSSNTSGNTSSSSSGSSSSSRSSSSPRSSETVAVNPEGVAVRTFIIPSAVGTSVSGADGIIPSGASISKAVFEDTSDVFDAVIFGARHMVAPNAIVAQVLSMDVNTLSGSILRQLDGTVSVTIPWPTETLKLPAGKKFVVYRLEENGFYTPLETEVKDNQLSFNTDAIQMFVVLIVDDDTEELENVPVNNR